METRLFTLLPAVALLLLLSGAPAAAQTGGPTACPTSTITARQSGETGSPIACPTLTLITDPTGTATSPATATATATITATATPPPCRDAVEPNDTAWEGAILIPGQGLSGLTLVPEGDVDYFLVWGKAGKRYQITTLSAEGLDTRLRVYDQSGGLLAENDDYKAGNPGSQVIVEAPADDWLAVAADSVVPLAWGCRTYGLMVEDVAPPTATPTATAGPTLAPATPAPPAAVPGELTPDRYEPNYDLARATELGVGQLLKLNFNPWPAGAEGPDNDFFRLHVKTGQQLLLETLNLAPGLDTNLILYQADGSVIGGNDDCAPGETRSCLAWSPDYTGPAYLLVGPVGSLPVAVSANARDYSLSARDRAGETPTPTPGGIGPDPRGIATPSPTPAAPAAPPSPTPTLSVRVRRLTAPPPTPTRPAPQAMTIEVVVFYDENNNQAQDLNEGVAGVSVRALDALDNRPLGHLFTDASGHIQMTVAATGAARVSVPYLGYNQLIKPPGGAVVIRVAALRLPSLIP